MFSFDAREEERNFNIISELHKEGCVKSKPKHQQTYHTEVNVFTPDKDAPYTALKEFFLCEAHCTSFALHESLKRFYFKTTFRFFLLRCGQN